MPGMGPNAAGAWMLAACLCGLTACQTPPHATRSSTARRAGDVAAVRLAADQPLSPPTDVPARQVGPAETQPANIVERIGQQVRDPAEESEYLAAQRARLNKLLETVGADEDLEIYYRRQLISFPRLLEHLGGISGRPVQRMTLQEVIQRTLRNSYLIQTQAYNPAIDAARVVEAEANFDAVFFTNFTNDKQNRPSSSQLSGTDTQNRIFESGVRKLLATGMQVQAGYNLTRTETDLVFQTLNPSYFNQFFVEFRQPLLRGFGLDFNRSEIELRRLDRSISAERFGREVRETLFNVEQAYWRLYQARLNLAVSARLLTDLEAILNLLEERLAQDYDVYEVQVNLARSRVETRRSEFIRLRNEVRNAEDAVKALMNDPDLNFSKDFELIPADEPTTEPMVFDAIGEVTAALSHRAELKEARLAIEQAQITIGVAKNQALPRLDLVFRYVVDGLGANADQAFSQLSENDFHEYLLQLQFEWPIGARAGEAQIRQARFRQAQAIVAHRAQIENVILEVQQAIRELHTNYDQIGPSLRAAEASAGQLFATQRRQEKRDLPNLQVELDAHEALANARQNLLRALAEYNIALINLERRKGTLLEYNRIVLKDAEDSRMRTAGSAASEQ